MDEIFKRGINNGVKQNQIQKQQRVV